MILCNKTSAPFVTSSLRTFSLSLWLIPSIHGINIVKKKVDVKVDIKNVNLLEADKYNPDVIMAPPLWDDENWKFDPKK